MKDYQKFITSIVVFTVGFYCINNIIKIPYLSASFISTILFFIFCLWNNYLWKIKKFAVPILGKIIGFYDYPNISGEWETEYKTSYNREPSGQYVNSGKGVIEIKQTYSSIYVNGKFSFSKFESFTAELKEKECGKWVLIYAYTNKPTDEKLCNSLHGGMHEGFCLLEIINSSRMEGYYVNDMNRETKGKIILIKSTKN